VSKTRHYTLSEVELREQARRLIERSTSPQGLDFHVTDQATLDKVARIVAGWIAEESVMAGA
jgi:hypothetical protein